MRPENNSRNQENCIYQKFSLYHDRILKYFFIQIIL